MLNNYFKVALRNLLKNKALSAINISGLAMGMVACLLILQYVSFEMSFENFQTNKDSVYRLLRKYEGKDGITIYANNVPALGPLLKTEFSEIEHFTRVIPPSKVMSTFSFSYDNNSDDVKTFNENRAFYVDNDFLKIFTVQWSSGNIESALQDPYSVILSRSAADKYFGSTDPINQLILLNGNTPYKVTGVFEDLPENSHLQFDLLCSFTSLPESWDLDNNWGWGNFYTYALVESSGSIETLQAQYNEFLFNRLEQDDSEHVYSMVFQPVGDIHLNSNHKFEISTNGDARAVYFLSFVGFFILVIAWINYINLTTSKSIERAREVGIRKALGAVKSRLIGQFLTEAFVINLFALIMGITVFQLVQPVFNSITGIQGISALLSSSIVWYFLAAFVFGTLLSGFYPALIMSSYKPALVLKGKFSSSTKGLSLKRGLVIFQFAVSILFVAGTLIVFKQLRFMQNQDLGLNINQTLVIRKPTIIDSTYTAQFSAFKNFILQNPKVKNVTASSHVPGYELTRARYIFKFGGDQDFGSYPKVISIDGDFIPGFKIIFLAGNNFSDNFSNDNKFIINRATAKELGIEDFEEAIGGHYHFEDKKYELIGITENYSQEYLKKGHEPHFYYVNPGIDQYYSLKLETNEFDKAIIEVKNGYLRFFPDNHFDFFFLDDFFNKQYTSDQIFGRVFGFFATLAIIVASMGLFGLSSHMITLRTKEIGIRKILGAGIGEIVMLLSRNYLYLILLGGLVGIPTAYLIFENWLGNYVNRITISWWMFFVPMIMIVMIAFIAIGYHTIKTALSNPVKTLRHE